MKTVFQIFISAVFVFVTYSTSIAQWIHQNSSTTADLCDVVMLDSTTAIAIGRNGTILRTTNSGTSWFDETAHQSHLIPLNGISFYDKLNGIIAGDNGVVLSSSNGGINWIELQIPGEPRCLCAFTNGIGSIYIGTDSGMVYSTSDTARTWTSEKISTWPIRSIFTYRRPAIIGVSKFALTSHSLCTQYVVPPPSWGEVFLPYFQGLGSEALDAEYCNGGGPAFIVGVQGDLLYTPIILRKSLSDSAWQIITAGLAPGVLYGVSAPSTNVIYVCGSNGMIYKSLNGGDTWIHESVPTTQNLNAIYFYNERTGFAVGDSGTIFFSPNETPINVDNREKIIPKNFILEQNYPNPFNPTTTISFSIPSRSYVSLKIFDLLGREVATIVSEELPSGNYSRQWNAAKMPSGVYFYRLQSRSYTETKKLMVLK